MRKRYRYSGRRTRRGMLVLLLLLSAAFLVSCVAGSNVLWVRGFLGFDVTDYGAEPSVRSHPVEGEISDRLCDLVEILTVGGITLEPFEGTSQAVSRYRDAILNDMLRDHYALYNGNRTLLDQAGQAYPGTVLSTLIPQTDFENAVFRDFGGTAINHKSGELFAYLSRVDAYTAPLQAMEPRGTVRVYSIEETLHTYRMTFTLSDGDQTSDLYTAVFVKRDSGNCYFYSLHH